MKLRSIGGALATGVLIVTVLPVAAQEESLPPVLRIFREEIKQGKSAAHEKTEASFVKMLTKHKYPNYSLACDVVAGPSEAWFFEGHDSFKSVENAEMMVEKNPAIRADFSLLDATDGELRVNSSTMLAVFRDDLSYRAVQFATELGKTRYFTMSIVRARPYMDARLAELGKQIIAANEKANIEVPVATYQIISGGQFGTYLLFSPLKTLQTMDEAPSRMRAQMGAMGAEKAMAFSKNASEVIMSAQSFLFAINPRMSYVSKEMAAQDPDFWTPKPATTSTKPAPPKSTEKPGAGQ